MTGAQQALTPLVWWSARYLFSRAGSGEDCRQEAIDCVQTQLSAGSTEIRFATMRGPGECEIQMWTPGLSQPSREMFALVRPDDRIKLAVNEQGGRRGGVDKVNRRRGRVSI